MTFLGHPHFVVIQPKQVVLVENKGDHMRKKSCYTSIYLYYNIVLVFFTRCIVTIASKGDVDLSWSWSLDCQPWPQDILNRSFLMALGNVCKMVTSLILLNMQSNVKTIEQFITNCGKIHDPCRAIIFHLQKFEQLLPRDGKANKCNN